MKDELVPGDLVMIDWGFHKDQVGLVVALAHWISPRGGSLLDRKSTRLNSSH